MTSADLLARLHSLGVVLKASDDKLHIDAPKGAVGDLMAELRAHKAELLKLLSERPACAICRNLRMAEVPAPGLLPPYRFIWGCAKGHLDHGHTTPDLRLLLAPDSCLANGDHERAFAKQG
jgi:hypothetical protein